MDGSEFLRIVGKIVGADNALRYASKFGDLDDEGYTNGILGYEALAFYVYTTSMSWHGHINRQLWSAKPTGEIKTFADVLDGAIRKLPPYRLNNGLVYRGYQAPDVDEFGQAYEPGTDILFPGFTSAAFREETAFGGNVLFIIRALNARAVWFLAADYLEDEVLFPTNCRFRVLERKKDGSRIAIILQELDG